MAISRPGPKQLPNSGPVISRLETKPHNSSAAKYRYLNDGHITQGVISPYPRYASQCVMSLWQAEPRYVDLSGACSIDDGVLAPLFEHLEHGAAMPLA